MIAQGQCNHVHKRRAGELPIVVITTARNSHARDYGLARALARSDVTMAFDFASKHQRHTTNSNAMDESASFKIKRDNPVGDEETQEQHGGEPTPRNESPYDNALYYTQSTGAQMPAAGMMPGMVPQIPVFPPRFYYSYYPAAPYSRTFFEPYPTASGNFESKYRSSKKWFSFYCVITPAVFHH